ncbi:hypothetical protein Slin15195_G062940 [Septoria linicola]|uniref:Uncharacterized protein n=1 Tax=Septoria linicola TaxID=215465 RepID=A0A9Q9AUW7_9PEZI|nr:hypothetical protein Slin15195_G062940 [Septoria linicola]
MTSGVGIMADSDEILVRDIRVTRNGRQYIYSMTVSPYPAIGDRETSTGRDDSERVDASPDRDETAQEPNSDVREMVRPATNRAEAAASILHGPGKALRKAYAIQEQDSEYKHLNAHEILYGLEAGKYVPSNHLYGGILLKVRLLYEPKQICPAINAKRAMEKKAMTPGVAANRHGKEVTRNNITKRLNSAVIEREKAVAKIEMRPANVSAALIQSSIENGKSQAAAEAQHGQKGRGKTSSSELPATAASNKRKRDSSEDDIDSRGSNSNEAERLYKKRKAHFHRPFQQSMAIPNTNSVSLDDEEEPEDGPATLAMLEMMKSKKLSAQQ